MASGKTANEKEEAAKSGKMELSMRAIGPRTWPTEKEDSYSQWEMSMKENGSMTRLREEGYIFIRTALPTQASGTTINSTATDIRNGQTEQSTRAIMLKE